MEKQSTVCVTGSTGYIGSCLVLKLLQRGYIVHATLRNLGDESKVQFLKKLDGADERLRLFEADLYDAEKFELAINGCDYVFLVATPFIHDHSNTQYKDTTEASLAALQIIMRACEKSKSVKRVIYTASVLSSSPLNEVDLSFKNTLDETCWTPLHCTFTHAQQFEQDYIRSKTLTEKEILSYNSKGEKREMDVLSLVCGLVGGNGILQYLSGSMSAIISPLSGNILHYKQLNLLQEVLGSVPLVHIDDVCEAHIFCMENQFLYDRVFCVSQWPILQEIVDYYQLNFPHASVLKEGIKNGEISKPHNATKLLDLGFKYKYNLEQILDDTVQFARRVSII